ncbi:hypothetical protein GS872_00720 [Rhodococcus hoagii]|nr:hypothetical protein [Prescottella equi]
MNTTHHDSDVIIVGAGPSADAREHPRHVRRSVTVLEALDDLIDYPRGVGLDDESFRTIQTVDLVDSVRPHTNPQHIMRLVNGAGKVILVNNPQTVEFGWERKHGFIQPEVDRALYEGLSRFDDVRVCSATRSRPSRRTRVGHRDRSRHRTRRHGRGARAAR